MALTRKFLSALGIEAEKIDEIISAHTETTDALKKERDDALADVEKYKADSGKLEKVSKELEALKADEGVDKWKKQYDELKAEYGQYKADVEAKEIKATKESAYRKLLKDASISDKRIDAILKVSSDTIDGIELDDAGNIKDADKLTESIKTEWSDFIVTERTAGAKTATPPAANNGGVKTKEEIMKIKDTQERQRAWGELIRNGGN